MVMITTIYNGIDMSVIGYNLSACHIEIDNDPFYVSIIDVQNSTHSYCDVFDFNNFQKN